MVGTEVVVGYVFAWLVRKARRAGARADTHADAAVDAAVDRVGEKLHALVAGKLAADSALKRLNAEAIEGAEAPTPRTVQRVALALEEAIEQDASFGGALGLLAEQYQAAIGIGTAVAGDGGLAIGGPVSVQADHGSVAAMVMTGGVNVGGNPPQPGTPRR